MYSSIDVRTHALVRMSRTHVRVEGNHLGGGVFVQVAALVTNHSFCRHLLLACASYR